MQQTGYFLLYLVSPFTTERTKQLMGSTSSECYLQECVTSSETSYSDCSKLSFCYPKSSETKQVFFLLYVLNRFWRTKDPTIKKSFKFSAAISLPYFNLGLDAPDSYIQRLLENSKPGDIQGEEKLFWMYPGSTVGCFVRSDACIVPWNLRAGKGLSILKTNIDYIYVNLE